MRAEFTAFLGIIVFLESSWRLPWCASVYASDATEEGWGIAVGSWPVRNVASAGRQPERRRFKFEHSTRARDHVMLLYGLEDLLATEVS